MKKWTQKSKDHVKKELPKENGHAKKWIQNNYDHLSNIGSAIASVLLSMLASFFYGVLTTTDESPKAYIFISLLIFTSALVIGLSFLSARIKKYIFKDKDYNRYVQKAYLAIQDYSLESQSFLMEHDPQKLDEWFLFNIQLAVNKCYDFFSSSFSSGEILIEETRFEVTYMTKSYKDKEITIPCSCNREKRTPTSMLMRHDNPTIYADTITAEIYREYDEHCKPSFRVIENTANTSNEDTAYKFVYENQKDRIKSSVVLPVLSHKNELLGTLVVHCNTPSFFSKKQSTFWYEILQLFACEIGKNKLLLDTTIVEGNEPF